MLGSVLGLAVIGGGLALSQATGSPALLGATPSPDPSATPVASTSAPATPVASAPATAASGTPATRAAASTTPSPSGTPVDGCHLTEAEVTARHPGAQVKDADGTRVWLEDGRVVAQLRDGVGRDGACLPQ